jgi:hypothetical protein
MLRQQLIEKAKKLLPCDSARIVDFEHTTRLFLIVGWNRHSKNEWSKNNEPVEFDYLEERTVANGLSLQELRDSFAYYLRLLKLDEIADPIERVKKYIQMESLKP